MGNETRHRLAAAAAFLVAATALSRVLGLVREIVMVRELGLGAAMGAFTVAFKIPGLVRTLLGDTALSAAFIPVFSELLERERRAEAWRVARTVTLLATVVLGLVSALGMLFAPQVVHLFAPGWGTADQATIDLAVELTRIMFPTVVLFAVAGIFMGILNAYDHFSLPALAPILWNLVIIGAVVAIVPLFATDAQRFRVLAWAIVVGTLIELVLQLPAVLRRSEGRRFSLSLRDPGVRRVAILLGPVVLSLGVINFNALIDTIVASFIGTSAPAYIDKAYRLFQLPQGMFAIAVGTVLFPTLSRLAASGRFDRFRESLSEGIRQVVFVTLPFTAFFMVLAFPTVRLVYQHGSLVTTDDTWQVAKALIFFSPGMVFVSATTLLTRAFYGIQKTWVPLVVGLVNLALNAALDLLLYKPLGVGGITLSTSLVSAFYFAALLIMLSREIGGVRAGAILRSAAQALVALVPLVLVGYGSWWAVQHALDPSEYPSNQSQIAAIVVAYALGGLSYLGAAWLLRMDEPRQLLAVVRRRRTTQDAGPVLEAEERVD